MIRAVVCAGFLVAAPRLVAAHPLAPALLELHERGDGRVDVGWKTPLLRPRGTELFPILPPRCHALTPPSGQEDATGRWSRWRVDCGAAPLVGEQVGIAGDAAAGIGALVRLTLADDRVVEGVVSPERPLMTVPARPRAVDIARDYARLGVEHILGGPDHLLFVFGLVLLAGGTRRLLGTVTAFTAGHSVTLTLAALGFVEWPSRPIESAIAATVLALAVELARRPRAPTLIRRRPWAMAAAFGLLHGLGFAAALREAGLPAGEIPLALLSFNTGIELGQLAFVALVLGIRATLRQAPGNLARRLRPVSVYAMGSLAAAWWLERTFPLFAS